MSTEIYHFHTMSAVRLCYDPYYDSENSDEGRILPPELLEQIFINLDAPTFCHSREVCRSWNEIIKPLQAKKSVWRTFCFNEISENALEEILEFKDKNSSDFDWMNAYKKWYSSKMITNSPHLAKKIDAFYQNPVTAVRISGSWIITGHADGRLCTWNILTGDLCQNVKCHLMIILDMALVDLLNLGSYYGDEELPWAHHHIITVSRDRYIHILSLLEPMESTDSDIQINCSPEDLSQVRVFNDIFAVSSRDNTVTMWKMKTVMKPYFHLDVTLLRKIAGPRDYLLSVGLWHDQIQCITHGSTLREFQPEKEEWTTGFHIPLAYPESPYYRLTARSAFLCRKNISFLISGKEKLIISINDGMVTQFCLREKLGTDIIILAFHGTILALGGENGNLFLYHIPHEEHLLNRDFTKPDFVLSLSEVSIITLDISLQQDTPVVVACTTDTIHYVKWYKEDKAAAEVKRRNMLEAIVMRL